MKKRKIVSLLLVGAMFTALVSGCGSAEEETGTGTSGSVEEAASQTSGDFERFDETQTISMYTMSFFGDKGVEEVIDEINKISEEAINVRIEYHALDTSEYVNDIGLMLAGGEPVDLVSCAPIGTVSFGTMQAQNELMDITDLLDEYAPDAKELVKDYFSATTLDGVTYALPYLYNFNGHYSVLMRKDVLEALGLTEKAESMSTWSDYEEILKEVKEKNDTLPAELQTVVPTGNIKIDGAVLTPEKAAFGEEAFADNYGYDALGDTYKMIYVDEDGQVKNRYATEDYRKTIERVHSWYEKGYIYRDASTTDQMGATLMKNNVIFSIVSVGNYGEERSQEVNAGHECIFKKIIDIPLQTGDVNLWGWGVPATSENPEAAVAFLNLMYTNRDIQNLFVYGIEGRDYELNEAGEAVELPDLQYRGSGTWAYGNQSLVYAGEGEGADLRERQMKNLEEAEVSPFFGFTIDTSGIANEITAVYNVIQKYAPGIESGVSDPALLDQMLAEMDASGMKEILDYYQEHLDAWVAENK